MSEATHRTTLGGCAPPFILEIINLDAHPDGALLGLCACLGRMRSATAELVAAVERTPALTIEGRGMKELTL